MRESFDTEGGQAMTYYTKQPFHRDVTCVIIHLADDEYGNEAMKDAARHALALFPDVDCVEVYEHSGWWLIYDRTGRIVATANDGWPGDDYSKRFWRNVWARNIVRTIRRTVDMVGFAVDSQGVGHAGTTRQLTEEFCAV